MAVELSKYVVYGEIYSTSRNSVCGWLGLMGMECPVRLELSGNCEPDLAGKHIRFRARAVPEADFDEKSVRNFQIRHIGPVGKITAALNVRVDASGNMFPPDALGPATEDEWKRLLHIEWFGQNGRTVVQIVDPVIQEVCSENSGKDAADSFFGALFPDESEPEEPDAFLSESGANENAAGSECDDFDDWLAPSGELQWDLDRQANEPCDALGNKDDVAEDIREMELLDDLIESDVAGEELVSVLDESTPLPDPDSLDENQAQNVLRVILARLAIYGVAVHMCEHVSALETYRMFLEHMSPEAHCHRELKGTGWVQTYMTSEYCAACEAEFEREWQMMEAKSGGT